MHMRSKLSLAVFALSFIFIGQASLAETGKCPFGTEEKEEVLGSFITDVTGECQAWVERQTYGPDVAMSRLPVREMQVTQISCLNSEGNKVKTGFMYKVSPNDSFKFVSQKETGIIFSNKSAVAQQCEREKPKVLESLKGLNINQSVQAILRQQADKLYQLASSSSREAARKKGEIEKEILKLQGVLRNLESPVDDTRELSEQARQAADSLK
jgi:hypothetical protein